MTSAENESAAEGTGLPVLHVFAISHYCEKARWALDRLGIEYELRHLAPGAHLQVAQDLGAPASSLPLLLVAGEVVHGSGAIIDWADALRGTGSKRLSPDASLLEECSAVEARLDVSGVHMRRYYYSEALVDHPDSVLPIFVRGLPESEHPAVEESWGFVCKAMVQMMDLGPEQRLESRGIVMGELDWLEGLLSDGRRYLVGDRFSRADLTAASLLAGMVSPAEHPTYGGLEVPPLARQDMDLWASRPIGRWIAQMYREHRQVRLTA